MKQWFDSLAPRERLLVASAALVAVAGLFFLLVWQPLRQGVAEMEQRIAGERAFVNWIASIEAEAVALRRRSGAGMVRGRGDPLLAVVDRTSRAAGLGAALQRIQPEGDAQATVTLDDAGFNKLLQWLHGLEKSYGIEIQSLAVTREEQSGTVQARVTLRRTSG